MIIVKVEDPEVLPVDIGEVTEVKANNQAVLDKFSEDEDGNLFYGDERIASVPPGGSAGQVLEKKSDQDYDYGWGDSVTLEYNAGSLKIF